MSELLSARLLIKLRRAADDQSRPKERNATLDRLVEACNDIASGDARKVIGDGLPDANVNFRRSPTLIKPPRIEEYVLARRALDVKARRIPSKWTGPMAITIRKDAGLLEYVRAREQEQAAATPGKVVKSVDSTLDRIEDIALRSEVRFVLSRARQAEQDLLRLKAAMRKLRPTFDIEALIAGRGNGEIPRALEGSSQAALPAPRSGVEGDLGCALLAVMKLTNSSFLSKFGLELSAEFGNVVERKTRMELMTAEEVAALRAITGAN